MPTYEYACKECGNQFEVVQSFRDDPLQTCEACGGPLRKVFSAAGIIFKGSGYYVTDTRAQAAGEQKSGSSNGKPAGASAGGGTDSKDAGKDAGSSSAKDSDAKASPASSSKDRKPSEGSSD